MKKSAKVMKSVCWWRNESSWWLTSAESTYRGSWRTGGGVVSRMQWRDALLRVVGGTEREISVGAIVK